MGIPEADQASVRDAAVRKLRNEPGEPLQVTKERYFSGRAYAEYVAWRAENPSDDLVTELLNVEFDDLAGERRKLSQEELLTFIAVIAGAGVETTGRLFGWIGKVLAEHPDQRAEVAKDRSLVAEHDRGAAPLRAARARTSLGTSPRTSSTTGRSSRPAAPCC